METFSSPESNMKNLIITVTNYPKMIMKFTYICSIMRVDGATNLVPRQIPCAPRARAATYPLASTIPPAAMMVIFRSPTTLTTFGNNESKASCNFKNSKK